MDELGESQLEKRLIADFDPSLSHSGVNGLRLASRIQSLSEIGRSEVCGSYRIGFSKVERQAKNLVKDWMDQAGMETREDAAGNIFGRLRGRDKSLPAVLSGSHVDTVPNGGHFDGVLGVLTALEVVEAWKESNYVPERPYEVVVFTDEEGSRFNGGFTGSLAMVGEIDIEEQKLKKDINGVPFEQVITNDGLSMNHFFNTKRDFKEINMFVEVHIEQGKRLEKEDVPVGIVTGIAGPCWMKITFRGTAGHAGNTPMNDRQDAMAAAGEFAYRVKTLPEKVSSSAVATVGKLHVNPNGVNVIPGEVELYVDIRDIHKHTRDELANLVTAAAKDISEKNSVSVELEETLRTNPVPIKEVFQEQLAISVEDHGITPVFLPSGAGHDAMIVGRHIPVAMLFVRSKNGISHNPKEWSSLNDCAHGAHVLKHFLEDVTEKEI
jgi:allantoate deiminase